MSSNPYQLVPNYGFWRKSISDVAAADVDPVVRARFVISRHEKVVTAGSCFAQHIARRLAASGFNHFVTEAANPAFWDVVDQHDSYGIFSARYGNIYTARQLLQLLRRAYGLFEPAEPPWITADGALIDPFRPLVQPGGFATRLEFEADRVQHFRAVRKAIDEVDIFVFTLGLTEAWEAKADGAVFPICPGVSGGTFDPNRYQFVNFGVNAVATDLSAALAFILSKNPRARFILTVSPVPLVATMEDRSVLVSTTYSKSVLRVAAEMMQAEFPSVAYFPSYEIICGNFSRGNYFASDLRSVTEAGVDHVMRLFMRHYGAVSEAGHDAEAVTQAASAESRHVEVMERIAAALCDEELLDRGWRS
jgi:hypothetical protein